MENGKITKEQKLSDLQTAMLNICCYTAIAHDCDAIRNAISVYSEPDANEYVDQKVLAQIHKLADEISKLAVNELDTKTDDIVSDLKNEPEDDEE